MNIFHPVEISSLQVDKYTTMILMTVSLYSISMFLTSRLPKDAHLLNGSHVTLPEPGHVKRPKKLEEGSPKKKKLQASGRKKSTLQPLNNNSL